MSRAGTRRSNTAGRTANTTDCQQRDLSVFYSKVGDGLVAQGNLPEALKSFLIRRMRVTWLHALIWKWRHLEGRASFWVR
jgi:hypothetical protein